MRNWGNGIEASAGEGVAAQQPPEGEACTAQRAMCGNCDLSVFRASGQVAASTGAQRVQGRGEPAAVEGEKCE
jgi:hypothetical protein